MDFNFEPFDKRTGRLASKRPEMSIQASGSASLNTAAALLIDKAPYVEMFFDREQKVIGIKGVTEETENAFAMRAVRDRGTYLIGCKAFCDYYELTPKRATRYTVGGVTEHGILYVDLSVPGREYGATSTHVHAEANGNGKVSGSDPTQEGQTEVPLSG